MFVFVVRTRTKGLQRAKTCSPEVFLDASRFAFSAGWGRGPAGSPGFSAEEHSDLGGRSLLPLDDDDADVEAQSSPQAHSHLELFSALSRWVDDGMTMFQAT
nr:hypothetical protein CFP56_67586 [Quercus suber]